MTYNFETNIELRVPGTDRVYAIQRMTSEYAVRHPLNVDAFINEVYEKYQQIAAEDPQCAAWVKSREELRRQWVITLGCTRIGGDASIYPNNNGRHEPALMEVWLLAGDYWRRGFRLTDTLPDRVPLHSITRLDDGAWISLAPKELHLLDDIEKADEPMQPIIEAASHQAAEPENNLVVIEPEINQAIEPTAEVEPILMEPEPIIETVTEPEPIEAVIEPEIIQTVRQRNAEARRKRREEREARQRAYEEQMAREAQEAEDYAREQERKKIFAAIGAAAITLVLIYFFGLLGPAVFGLLAGGVLKG